MATTTTEEKVSLFEQAPGFAGLVAGTPDATKASSDLLDHCLATPATVLGVSLHFLAKALIELEVIKKVRASSRRALDIASVVRAAVSHDKAPWEEATLAIVNEPKWNLATLAEAKPADLNKTVGSAEGWKPQYTEGVIASAGRFMARLREAQKRLGGMARATALFERLLVVEAASSAATAKANSDAGAVLAAVTGHKARLVQEFWMSVRNRLQVALPGPGGALGPAAAWADGWLKYEAPELPAVLDLAVGFGHVGHEQVAEPMEQ